MDTGNTAWVMMSMALVLFMTPGLAFFYAGMVRSLKDVSASAGPEFFAVSIPFILFCAYQMTSPSSRRRSSPAPPPTG